MAGARIESVRDRLPSRFPERFIDRSKRECGSRQRPFWQRQPLPKAIRRKLNQPLQSRTLRITVHIPWLPGNTVRGPPVCEGSLISAILSIIGVAAINLHYDGC
jgi:hypothetical protein